MPTTYSIASDDWHFLQICESSNCPYKKELYTTLEVIACKILRVIFAILTKGTPYDPKKMLGDIVRPNEQSVQVA